MISVTIYTKLEISSKHGCQPKKGNINDIERDQNTSQRNKIGTYYKDDIHDVYT